MLINKCYRIEEKDQRLTLEIIKSIGFEEALEKAYSKALYLVANSPKSTLSTEWLAWSHNLNLDSRGVESSDLANDLLLLSSFYRRLAHKVYWYQKKVGSIGDLAEFIRLVN